MALRNLAGVDLKLFSTKDNRSVTVRNALNQGHFWVQGEINSANVKKMTGCSSNSSQVLWSLDSILVPKAYESYYNASTLAYAAPPNSLGPQLLQNITPLVTQVAPGSSAFTNFPPIIFAHLLLLVSTIVLL